MLGSSFCPLYLGLFVGLSENVDSLVGIGEVGLDYTPRVLGGAAV